ncbi:Hermansky-Pudlak syndrome 1 -like protein [Brachionus plicatilis]|uniref:Hermansky-Pudlak syndrome 1-like protein n=1 Tax=Brachionus plicatilis TaxID=10195 RepID=A0A3M7SA92_BRAPC|nr:Hermansky-Pudlak syndrome 1 -like protein [Brachionus plicatilis]
MSISQSIISILLFETKRKFLIFKILTNELKDHLIKEFHIYFSDGKLENQVELNDDLIYEYFAPIVNSFEISRELNYRFDHVILKKSNFYIKFYLYKNCLLLSILPINQLNSLTQNTDLTKKIYGDFYSNWFLKSFITLAKFKFGICLDEKCIQIDNSEISELFLRWSNIFFTHHLYFIEAIEEVQINDDIKKRCEYFIKDFVTYLAQSDTIMADIEHLDRDYSKNNEELLLGDEDKTQIRNNELEIFFSDPSMINFYMIASNGKILFTKYCQPKLPFDPSSIFVLLIESFWIFDSGAHDQIEFKYPNNSLTPDSINSDNEHYLTVRSTFASQNSNFFTSTPKSAQDVTKDSPVNQTVNQKVLFKTSSCFLRNKNKSLGFYDVFYLKIADNLCLISVKDRKYSWYCELISDFESLLIDFLVTLNKQKSSNNTKFTKQFFTFFINKLIDFFEHLKNLKNELSPKEGSKSRRKSSNLLSRINKNLIKPNLSFDETILNRKKSSATSESKLINFDQARLNGLIKSLLIKLNNFNESQQLKILAGTVNTSEQKCSENDILFLEKQIEMIISNLDDLFYEIFLTNLNTKASNIFEMQKKEHLSDRSANILEALNLTYLKYLNDYKTFLDIKIKRNYTMAYYSHLMTGLVHFSFVNRNTHRCIIPTFDCNFEKIDEKKINESYRKYLPIIYNLMHKNDSTKFKFTDEKLGLKVTYSIWLKGKDIEKLPINFNEINEFYRVMDDDNSTQFKDTSYQASCLGKKFQEKNDYHQPGMTDKNFFDLLKTLCYPNAHSDSITCYELITIHPINISDKQIFKNINTLMDLLKTDSMEE